MISIWMLAILLKSIGDDPISPYFLDPPSPSFPSPSPTPFQRLLEAGSRMVTLEKQLAVDVFHQKLLK